MTQSEQKIQDNDQAMFIASAGYGAEFADLPLTKQLDVARTAAAYTNGMHPHHGGAVSLVNRLVSHLGSDIQQLDDERRQVQLDEQRETNARNIQLQKDMAARNPNKDFKQLKPERFQK